MMMKRPSAELRRVAVATLRDGERFAQGRDVGDHYAAAGPLIHVELALAFYGFAELALGGDIFEVLHVEVGLQARQEEEKRINLPLVQGIEMDGRELFGVDRFKHLFPNKVS